MLTYISYSQENSITIGVSKYNNTWETKGILNYKLNSNFGDFEIYNNYIGNVITNISNSFRDAENFHFNYKYPIWNNIFVVSETKYNLLSDRNSTSLNKLEKLSEQVGLSGMLWNTLLFKAIYGLQNNKQSELKALGNLINTSLELKQYEIDNWNIAAIINTEHLFLDDSRYSNDINVSSKLSKQFSDIEFLNLEVKYKKQARDFIQMLNSIEQSNNYAIESNNENRTEASINSKFELFNKTFINVEGNAGLINVERKYKTYYQSINNSRIGRNYDEWFTGLNASLNFNHNIFSHNIGFFVENKNEHYYLENIHNIELSDFNSEQLLEAQKDNNSFNIKLFYNSIIEITKQDSIIANISLSKSEYNTPSIINKDERDILNHIFSIEYRRQCSKILTITSKINYLQNHIVFINKERSSQNNWNKIISYQNGITINTKKFYYSPQFEILANYTIYDYETFNKSIRSYSIRQLSYKDTISVILSNGLSLTNKIYFRYYEQSKLFWDSFSEQPQRQNADITSSLMCKYDFTQDIKTGLGMKLYYMDVGIINTVTNHSVIYSYAPEILLIFKLNKWIFNCNSWFEFRNENHNNKQLIPHFNIITSYIL